MTTVVGHVLTPGVRTESAAACAIEAEQLIEEIASKGTMPSGSHR
jgi:hypothetical protein